jgi:predicted Rossmann-fold nucleotide-binding protein
MATTQLEPINIEAKKLELISKITRLLNYSVLLELEKILKLTEEEHWDTLTNWEKEKIEQGLESIKQGKVISHTDAKRNIESFKGVIYDC